MALRLGLGPVFDMEFLAVPRRWQFFASRVIFVSLLLGVLWLSWQSISPNSLVTLNDLERLSTEFVRYVILTQLALVMLGAPAVMAGSICVDKARGTLHHVFVTDLSNREIILGKFAARFLSLVLLIACGAPVLALGGLLGGLDYEALFRAYAITLGTTVLACSLAMMFSLWARKPNHALLPTYALLGIWCASPYVYASLGGMWNPTLDPTLQNLILANPFLSSTASYTQDDPASWIQPITFLVVTFTLSALFVVYTIKNLRSVVIGQANRGTPKKQRVDAPLRILDRLPGPLLDSNPILWREWHRKKPSKWTGRFWTIYTILSLFASALVLIAYFTNPSGRGPKEFAATVNGVEVAIGLLLLTISATTSLAEERDRGSLDVIMTTPLSSATIVWGKWWGSFAMVPRMAILPIWVSAGLAMVSGSYLAPFLLIGLILAYSAFVTSLGIAIAIWVPRLGRAVVTGIAVVVVLNLMLYIVHKFTLSYEIFAPLNASFTRVGAPWSKTYIYEHPTGDWILLGNPYSGIYEITRWSGVLSFSPVEIARNNETYVFGWNTAYGAMCGWITILAAMATWLGFAATASFDRCLGRMTTDLRVNKPPLTDPSLPAFPEPTSTHVLRKA